MNKKIVVECSFDDGNASDLRVASLLRKYKLPGMFYIPIGFFERHTLTDNDLVELSRDFDIGSHTINHYALRALTEDDLKYELEESKYILESRIGRPVTSLAYPKGRYDKKVKEMAKKVGYTEGRTTHVLHIKQSPDPFEKETTIHVYPRREYNGVPIVEIAKKYIDLISEHEDSPTGGMFHLWGH